MAVYLEMPYTPQYASDIETILNAEHDAIMTLSETVDEGHPEHERSGSRSSWPDPHPERLILCTGAGAGGWRPAPAFCVCFVCVHTKGGVPLWRILPLPSRRISPPRKVMKKSVRDTLTAYTFIAPNFIGFCSVHPGAHGLCHRAGLLLLDGRHDIEFVAIDNFVRLFTQDRIFQAALVNTIVYVIGTVPLTLVCSLGHGRCC